VSVVKKWHGFSSRRAHYKRHPNADLERRVTWQNEIETLLASVDKDMAFNDDETSWRFYTHGVTAWTPRGAEKVTISIQGSEKKCLTVMVTIRADGTKDPLYVLAHGKTARVEATQIGNIGEHGWDYSASGWMTPEIFGRWLEFEREFVQNKEKTLHFLLDVDPVYIQAAARE
jgi:hypothetical protein